MKTPILRPPGSSSAMLRLGVRFLQRILPDGALCGCGRPAIGLFLLLLLGAATFAGTPTLGGALPEPLPLFPPDNWWNVEISDAPVDARSADFIRFINSGSVKRLHPDFSGDLEPGGSSIGGFPYIVVDGSQAKKAVEFLYDDESDGVDHASGRSFPFYPIPDEAITQPRWIEGGPPGNVDLRKDSDRHMIIVDRDNRFLYELYNVFYDGTRWLAGSGARFDLRTNNRRPEGWTSSDAAGLAILPGLVRYDEVFGSDEIRHAFRCTVRATNGYVFPASHRAGSNPLALPMGARLRLKSTVDLSAFRPEIRKIFRAMQRYGLIVADNGSDMYVSGTYDPRWDNEVLNPAFRSLNADDFEVIRLGYEPPQALYFAHLAAGGPYATVFTLSNTGATNSTGRLILTGRDGEPMLVSASSPGGSARPGLAADPFSFLLPPAATWSISVSRTDSGEDVSVGWGRVESTGGAVSGVAAFQVTERGILKSVAGVFGSRPVAVVSIPVDNREEESRFTGFAVANPGSVDLDILLSVLDENGQLKWSGRPAVLNPLGPMQQRAVFLHELVSGMAAFRGVVRLEAGDGGEFVAVALVQDRGCYSALPVRE